MVRNDSEDLIALITGKILIMNEQKINQLYVFKKRLVEFGEDNEDSREPMDGEQSNFRYDLIKRVIIRDIDIFKKGVCIDYHFFEEKGKLPDKIIFCKKDIIFSFNFETEEIQTVYKLAEPFKRQPL